MKAQKPNECDYCQSPIRFADYRLEFTDYKPKDKERANWGKIICHSCHKHSERMLVFGGAK